MAAAAQARQLGADRRQLGRLVAHRRPGGARRGGAIEPLRRDVGRIGLGHDRPDRHGDGDAPDAQRPLEGDGAAEAEAKAELDECARLLLAAVEGVGDAAVDGRSTQMLEDGVDGAPDVEQDRQAELGGEPELAGEHLRLPIVVEAGDEMIQANLADRDQARVTGMARERVAQVPRDRRRRPDRCTSDGCRARRPVDSDARARAPARSCRRRPPE